MTVKTRDTTSGVLSDAKKQELQALLDDAESRVNSDSGRDGNFGLGISGGGMGGGDDGGVGGGSRPGSSDDDSSKGIHTFEKIAVVTFFLFFTRSCASGNAPPIDSTISFISHYTGFAFYLIAIVSVFVYVGTLVFSLPLKPTWTAHHLFQSRVNLSILIIPVTIAVQRATDYIEEKSNSSIGSVTDQSMSLTQFGLSQTLYIVFFSTVLLITYKCFYHISTPVKTDINGKYELSNADNYRRSIVRYMLSCIAGIALLQTSLILILNILYVLIQNGLPDSFKVISELYRSVYGYKRVLENG